MPTGLTRSDGKKPDGLTLIPWRKERSSVWDATWVDTFVCYLNLTSKECGAAAKLAERGKLNEYDVLCKH